VARWCAWLAGLADPKGLARACTRLHPDGMPVVIPEGGGAATVTLALLEQWALIVTLRGISLPGGDREPGWVRLLADQLDRFGVVSRLTRDSPPLRITLAPD
jgi:hypothetical protein